MTSTISQIFQHDGAWILAYRFIGTVGEMATLRL